MIALWIFISIVLCIVFGVFNLSGLMLAICGLAWLLFLTVWYQFTVTLLVIDAIFITLAILLLVKPLRLSLISKHIFSLIKKSQPPLSETEQQALNVGSVGFEGQIFSGNPSFQQLLDLKPVQLSKEEQEFLDGPVEELCLMLDDYTINQEGCLPKNVWDFIKSKGFLAMIIPKKYGGLEFSTWAHASVILKLGSRNLPAAISVGVPNSLGPAELLLHYGTKEQQDYYLPRLAQGEEIPCFALTSPYAGSDAASIRDFGVVCYGEFKGQKFLGIKLNFEKRYITLAPVATLIGLAFRLYDPEQLLSSTKDIGITCALLPRDVPGISIGTRHNPMNVKFQNGPVFGKDVFIPLDFIIGGQKMMGQGWRMLMECLSVGRAVTLPSAGSGMAMKAALASGCYARIRHQFGLPIGRFLGVQEPLARIAANAYLNKAVLRFVIAHIDNDIDSPVASAIAKYHTTERCRQAVNDAMDIHGGKGICLGPNNYLNSLYQMLPVNITVEGANILTRTMIIFGQGLMRCHPYLKNELDAIAKNDTHKFDDILFKHTRFLFNNFSRVLLFGLAGSFFKKAPSSLGKKYYKNLARYSAAFALSSDIVAITLAGQLKRQENISARFSDILSSLFLLSACLKRFHDEGEQKADLPLLYYIGDCLLYDIEQNFLALFSNFPNRLLGIVLYRIIFPYGICKKKPADTLAHHVAQLLLEPNETLDRLTDGLFLSEADHNHLHTLKHTLGLVVAAEELEKRIHQYDKENKIHGLNEELMIHDALSKGIITNQEYDQLLAVVKARAHIIGVDDFKEL